MAEKFDTWESYFYPETYDPALGQGTLKNLMGERDSSILRQKEYARTGFRFDEVLSGQAGIQRTFDAEHVASIHGYIFQDVYEWAGQYRTVDLVKGHAFALVEDGSIGRHLDTVRDLVAGTQWDKLTQPEFATRAAEVFTHLNQAHPFREGNGRTAKAFMHHVADQSRFTLNFKQTTPDIWNEMSARSRFPTEVSSVDPRPMFYVFNEIAVERKGPIPKLDKPMDRVTQQKKIREQVQERLKSRKTPEAPKPPRQGPPSQRGPRL